MTQFVPFVVHVLKAYLHKASVAKAKSSQTFVLHLTESKVHPAKYVLHSSAEAVASGAFSQDLVIQPVPFQ